MREDGEERTRKREREGGGRGGERVCASARARACVSVHNTIVMITSLCVQQHCEDTSGVE